MVAIAAALEPLRSAFAPSPQYGHGRREPGRRNRPGSGRSARGNGGPHRAARSLRTALARILIVVSAATLLLVGPFLSSALPSNMTANGDSGTAISRAAETRIPDPARKPQDLRRAGREPALPAWPIKPHMSGLHTEAFLPT